MPKVFRFPSPQIYIFYGTRSNAEFVIHNGFFFEDNAHDRVKIKLGVSKSERLYAMKAEVLARAGIPAWVSCTGMTNQIMHVESDVSFSFVGFLFFFVIIYVVFSIVLFPYKPIRPHIFLFAVKFWQWPALHSATWATMPSRIICFR